MSAKEQLAELQRKVKKAELYEKVKEYIEGIFSDKDDPGLVQEIVTSIEDFCDAKISEIAGESPVKAPKYVKTADIENLGEVIEKEVKRVKKEWSKTHTNGVDAAGRPVDDYGDPMDPIAFSMKYIRKAQETGGAVMLKTADGMEVAGKLVNAKYPQLIIQLEDGRTFPALRSDVRFL